MTLQELSKLELEEMQCQIEAARMRRQIEKMGPELLEVCKYVVEKLRLLQERPGLARTLEAVIAKATIAKATK